MTAELRGVVLAGAYWLAPPRPGRRAGASPVSGAVAPEALAALEAVREDVPGPACCVVTSPDRLHADWLAATGAGRRRPPPSHCSPRSAPARRW